MKIAAITTKAEPQILKASKQVEDTFHKYLGRDAIFDIPKAVKPAETAQNVYFSPTTLIAEPIKEANKGEIIDFIF